MHEAVEPAEPATHGRTFASLHWVEATGNFTLRFPSGFLASCNSGDAGHHSQPLRLKGSNAWAELAQPSATTAQAQKPHASPTATRPP